MIEMNHSTADDIRALWSARAEGSLASANPDEVYDTIGRIADHPAESLHAMRIPADPAVPGMSDAIRDQFTSMYHAEVAASDFGVLDAEDERVAADAARYYESIARKCRLDRADVDDIIGDALMGNPGRLDAMLADYYSR